MLVNNGLYLIVLMFVPMQLLSLPYDAFAHIYFFLSIAGAVSNCYMFDPTKDKYYAIILMLHGCKTVFDQSASVYH